MPVSFRREVRRVPDWRLWRGCVASDAEAIAMALNRGTYRNEPVMQYRMSWDSGPWLDVPDDVPQVIAGG